MRPWFLHSEQIISAYQHDVPLSHFLKKYFKKHPILGGRDRKSIATIVYSYFRVSKGFIGNYNIIDLCHYCLAFTEEGNILIDKYLKNYEPPLENIEFNIQNIFYSDVQLSKGLQREDWLTQLKKLPRTFFRFLGKKTKNQIQLLEQNNLEFRVEADGVFSVSQGTKLQDIFKDQDYVIQDLSSYTAIKSVDVSSSSKVWDCCSGAGGKAIFLTEKYPKINLTCTDIRSSILRNLRERFDLYQLKPPRNMTIDLLQEDLLSKQFHQEEFDTIIADVPCSGSGTWARNPEEAYFFEPNGQLVFSELQKRITSNVLPYLKKGGVLYYITCSVFEDENEQVVKHLENLGLELIHSELINGIDNNADCMFYAQLRK